MRSVAMPAIPIRRSVCGESRLRIPKIDGRGEARAGSGSLSSDAEGTSGGFVLGESIGRGTGSVRTAPRPVSGRGAIRAGRRLPRNDGHVGPAVPRAPSFAGVGGDGLARSVASRDEPGRVETIGPHEIVHHG